jgi:hypothetical protein
LLAIDRRLAWVWPAAAALALMWLDGNPYPPSFGGIVLALLAAALAALNRSARPLWVTACVYALGLTLVAPSLVFSYLVVAAHPRATGLDSSTLGTVWSALLSRDQDLYRVSAVSWGWHEIGGYVGLFSALAVAGLMRPRQALPWVMIAAILFLLALGARGPWWPWPLLHELPVFSWERLAYRFIVPLVQVVAVLAGFGADWIAARCGRAAAMALVVAATLDCLWVGSYNLRYSLQNLAPIVPSEPFHQVREPGTGYYIISRDMVRLTEQNLGIINCNEYSDWSTPVAASGDPNYRGEYYLLGEGTVAITFWSPNRLGFAVDTPAPTTLVVNQNYDRFWRLTAGSGSVLSEGGLLAVSIPAGSQTLQLSYW